MALQFTPLSLSALDESTRGFERLLPPGTYPFQVGYASEQMSRRGVPMIRLRLSLQSPEDGTDRSIDDHLVADDPLRLWEFTTATELEQAYHAGLLSSEDCLGQRGQIVLGRRRATNAGPAKNYVVRYVPATRVAA